MVFQLHSTSSTLVHHPIFAEYSNREYVLFFVFWHCLLALCVYMPSGFPGPFVEMDPFCSFCLRFGLFCRPVTGTYDASHFLPMPTFLSTFQGQPLSSIPPQQLQANYSALSGLPPQHISQMQAPKQEQQLYYRPGFGTPSVQQPPVTGSYTLAANDLVAVPDRHIIMPAGPTSSAAYGGNSLAPAGTVGAVADRRKRKADDPLDAYGGHQRLQQPLPSHAAQIPQHGSIPQQVGAALLLRFSMHTIAFLHQIMAYASLN